MRSLKSTAGILLVLYTLFLVVVAATSGSPVAGELWVILASFNSNWLLAGLTLFTLLAVIIVHAGNLLFLYGNWNQKQFVFSRFWWYWTWALVAYLLLINPHVQYFLLSQFFGFADSSVSKNTTAVYPGTVDAMKQWWDVNISKHYNLLYIAGNILIVAVLFLYTTSSRQNRE